MNQSREIRAKWRRTFEKEQNALEFALRSTAAVAFKDMIEIVRKENFRTRPNNIRLMKIGQVKTIENRTTINQE